MREMKAFVWLIVIIIFFALVNSAWLDRDAILCFMRENSAFGYLVAALITATAVIIASFFNARATRDAAKQGAQNIERQILNSSEVAQKERLVEAFNRECDDLSTRVRMMKAINAEISVFSQHIIASKKEDRLLSAAHKIETSKGKEIPMCALPDFDGYDTFLNANIDNLGTLPDTILEKIVNYKALYSNFIMGYRENVARMSVPSAKELLSGNFRQADVLLGHLETSTRAIKVELIKAISDDELKISKLKSHLKNDPLHTSSDAVNDDHAAGR